MGAADLAAVQAIADRVHVAHPERAEVFAERLRLYPAGCFVLDDGGARALGYAISHPWQDGEVPALDTLIGALPQTPTAYYIHDIALLPAARRRGAARTMVARLMAQARNEGQSSIALVALDGTAPFWQRLGFRARTTAGLAGRLRAYGGNAAYMTRALTAG